MTAEESTGIYHPQTGTLNINGGSITGGVTGIEIRSGELNMTGGVVTGLGNPTKVEPNGNGTTSSGAGIAIAQHTTKLPIALNVTGGTVKGFSAIYENNPQNNSEDDLNKIELNINGGEFNAINNGTAVIHSQDFEDFVTKGEFNQPVDAKYLDNDLLFEVNNHDTYTYYDTFENALKAAEYGAKITGIAEGLDTPYYDLVIDPANGGEVKSVNAPRGSTFTLPTVTKSGYAFLGWACSDGKTYSALQEVTITANTTFTASWVRHPDTEYVPEPEEPEEPEVPAFPFYDVPTSAWYYTAVKYVYDNKLMDGVDTYVFAPNDTLTRAMVWTIIARMSGVDTTGGNTWYAKAQEWVITNGISDGENPTAAITRQELVTMLYRYAQIKGYDVSVGESTNILSYVDAASISEYAMSAFQWACGSGLTEGDENGALTPLATATRAQAAAMIMRFLSK
uniref:S-layer homology domain-containing protein n=1 Tax=Candidatus Scatomorpha intestinigallinarum TaxID=2840923 RepID=UPI0040266BBA